MSKANHNQPRSRSEQGDGRRKPYETPRIVETADFETLALATCFGPGQCSVINPSAST